MRGLQDAKLVEETNNQARQTLQKHVQDMKPTEKLRYSNILLRLHALPSINNQMIENLFCKHITGKTRMVDHLRDLVAEDEQVKSP